MILKLIVNVLLSYFLFRVNLDVQKLNLKITLCFDTKLLLVFSKVIKLIQLKYCSKTIGNKIKFRDKSNKIGI